MLEISDLVAAYGDTPAIFGISMKVAAGEVVSVVGANGAGKSTLLRAISGLLRPRAGTVVFEGRHLEGLEPHQIVREGIALVPEGRRLFGRMTVLQNLLLGAYAVTDPAQVRAGLELAFSVFPRLRERQQQVAGTLSGGEQQMVAIARGLMARPRLLMLDEPSLGLAPILVSEIFRLIQEIKSQGITILLVEQNVREALSLADRAYVLQTGRVVMEGRGRDLLEVDAVRQAYLGL